MKVIPSRGSNPARQLACIRDVIAAGDTGEALRLLSRVKENGAPARGADKLRAACFLRQQRVADALEALKEELRLFPDNQEAAALLQELEAKQSAAPLPEDPEFRKLFAAVQPHTMLSVERLFSLFTHARDLCLEDREGAVVECGVAGGGSAALLAGIVARHSKRPRKVFACDSFVGLPVPGTFDRHDGQRAAALGWSGGTCAAPVESLLAACRTVGAGAVVEPVRGFFAESLPAVRGRIGPIALLHVDGDWYESTHTVLDNLFDQVVVGGCIQIDDYGFWEGCRRAVEEFQAQRHLKFELKPIDATGVWLEKTGTLC